MADIPQIVLPHGGYRKLTAFQKSEVVYQMTVLFCRRFLPAHGDRTVDQMTQAARSCKQNIAEGSASSGTSKETELKLTNVARASLDELLEDYLDYLKAHDSSPWTMHDERAVTAKRLGREHSDWEYWRSIFASRPAEVCCNLAITLIHQTRSLLDSLIKHLEADFVKHGGYANVCMPPAPPREARTGISRSTVDSMARRQLLNLKPVRRKSAARCRSRYGASRRGRAGSRRGWDC